MLLPVALLFGVEVGSHMCIALVFWQLDAWRSVVTLNDYVDEERMILCAMVAPGKTTNEHRVAQVCGTVALCRLPVATACTAPS